MEDSSAIVGRSPTRLSDFVNRLEAQGRLTFTRDEAIAALDCSAEALQLASYRLSKKHRLLHPRRGFFVIVPLEHRTALGPPAAWYVDQLMAFEERPYYVGLLSAAELHGAAHQRPQVFQVVSDAYLRPLTAGRARFEFVRRKRIREEDWTKLKVPTGYIKVSTPETTALDLTRYPLRAGGIDNVATVLAELAERLDPQQLAVTAARDADTAAAQRLGHLLNALVGAFDTQPLLTWVRAQRPSFAKLSPDDPTTANAKDAQWKIIVNTKIEPDV